MAGKSVNSKEVGTIGKLYLKLYNFLQVIGWSYLLYQLLDYYLLPGNKASLWDTVKLTVIIFQNAAVLEIIHAATGLVKSNPFITTFQVFSRVMLVCGVLLATPSSYAPSSPGLPLTLLAWSITEIIRYLYYFTNLLGFVPQFLTYLRYTTFIVLYPIGVTGELLCLYSAQQYGNDHPRAWSYSLPNSWNFTFSYHYYIIIIMILYFPFFPQMYMHMFGQRRKILGKSTIKKTQ
ncbi:very-long-chain (3R)-3-hydroxyacyl-CoA dehydratase hpo-8 [Prorops nasuta]|uniref:very-long-chain (3R)-3-hydroxyacyl-CoA dehydratase hpo-8 n=1 Tax=Prorops nasuta TaxID=863751 RepID=UPI0034CD55A9